MWLVGLLQYFGETTEPCNNCDACLGYVSFDQTGDRKTIRTLRKEKVAAATAHFDPRSEALLGQLKALRMKIAKSRGVPAYVIFSDKSLIDMAARIPLTRWDFGEVHGVGEAKQEQFGAVFLKEITAFIKNSA